MMIDEAKVVAALADEIERASAQGHHLPPPKVIALARAIEPMCNVDTVLEALIGVLQVRAAEHREHADELRVLQRWIAETPGATTLADVTRLPGPHQAAARALCARRQDR
jgi:hypothetical protein